MKTLVPYLCSTLITFAALYTMFWQERIFFTQTEANLTHQLSLSEARINLNQAKLQLSRLSYGLNAADINEAQERVSVAKSVFIVLAKTGEPWAGLAQNLADTASNLLLVKNDPVALNHGLSNLHRKTLLFQQELRNIFATNSDHTRQILMGCKLAVLLSLVASGAGFWKSRRATANTDKALPVPPRDKAGPCQQIARSKAWYESLLNALPFPILAARFDTGQRFVNAAAKKCGLEYTAIDLAPEQVRDEAGTPYVMERFALPGAEDTIANGLLVGRSLTKELVLETRLLAAHRKRLDSMDALLADLCTPLEQALLSLSASPAEPKEPPPWIRVSKDKTTSNAPFPPQRPQNKG